MGKMTRDEFVSRLEKLDKDIDWDKAYKFFERQTGKRTETSKEVLRNSWVFDVVFHIYHGVGTSKITKSFRLRIINYVKTQHYKDNYKLFMGRDWMDLPAIKNGADPVDQHTKNCNALLISPMGKHLMKTLVESGGFYHVEGTGPEYLRKLKTKHKILKDKNVEDLSEEELKELIKTEIPDNQFDGPPANAFPDEEEK